MSIGMGMTFVPLTLTAVHHLRTEDSGIGSGVLNTMQQVGGALGLALLGTVGHCRPSTTAPPRSPAAGPGLATRRCRSPADLTFLDGAIFQATFTDGATNAFLVGVDPDARRLAGRSGSSCDVKHTELATDGPEGVHVG